MHAMPTLDFRQAAVRPGSSLARTLGGAFVLAGCLAAGIPSAAADAGRDQSAESAGQQAHRESSADVRDRLEIERELRQARRELAAAARKVQELQSKIDQQKAMVDVRRIQERITGRGRARIGVVVDTTGAASSGEEGATIVAITPGGAAEEAGLRPGDVILSVNGRMLGDLAEEMGGGRSRPHAAALVHAVRALEPGDEVTLDYRRDGRSQRITLEARAANEPPVWITPHVEVPAIALEQWPDALLKYQVLPDEEASPLVDLEMVALNPELGRYFGRKSGILVIRAPSEGPLAVRPGDVIVRIGREEPSTPWQALRALRMLQPGERVNLELVRDGAVVSVKAEAPIIRSIFAPRKIGDDD